jgi:transposase-like protein
MVNANVSKELQNVLPKCNPNGERMCYALYVAYNRHRRLLMPRKYSQSEKADALTCLHRTGSFPITAMQTGISERTLYTWRQQEFLQQTLQQPTPAPLLQKETPTFENDAQTLAYVRQQMMSQLVRLVSTFQEDNAIATPQQRALVLTQLIDRLIKLDDHLDPYMHTALYQFPDTEPSIFLSRRPQYSPEVEDSELEDNQQEDGDAQSFKYPESKTEASPLPSLF